MEIDFSKVVGTMFCGHFDALQKLIETCLLISINYWRLFD